MSKGIDKNRKIVGYINYEIAKKWFIEEYCPKPIVQTMSLYIHISKHAKDYISIDSLNYTLDHVSDVINTPDYVFYSPENNSLEFYKKLIENVVVIVKLTNKRELHIASIFPVRETKINNRKLKEPDIIKEQGLKRYSK